jgi:hypothetical protein
MSSVGSVFAQRPHRGKNYVTISTSAFFFPTTSVEATNLNGALQNLGTNITFDTVANATSTASGGILNGANAIGSYTPISIQSAYLLRDMGRYVNVFVNGVQLYTLALVQLKYSVMGQSEGISGSPPASGNNEGYNTFYVAVDTSNPDNDPGAGGVGRIGVARLF